MNDEIGNKILALLTNMDNRLSKIEGNPQKITKSVWSPREVAARYGIKDVQTIRYWLAEGLIKGELDEFSKRWIVPQSTIDYLDKTGGKPLKPTCLAV